MRDWTPLSPVNADAAAAVSAACGLLTRSEHEALIWSERHGRIEGPAVKNHRAALRLADLTWLVLDDRGRIRAKQPAAGTTLTAAAQWLAGAAPALATAQPSDDTIAEVFDTELAGIEAWLTSAHQVLTLLAGTSEDWSPPRVSLHPLSLAAKRGEGFAEAILQDAHGGAFVVQGPSGARAQLSVSQLDATGQREQVVCFFAEAVLLD